MNAASLFWSMLGILFIGLKLTGQITWSWWLVLLPLYGGLVIAAFLFVLLGVIEYIESK